MDWLGIPSFSQAGIGDYTAFTWRLPARRVHGGARGKGLGSGCDVAASCPVGGQLAVGRYSMFFQDGGGNE